MWFSGAAAAGRDESLAELQFETVYCGSIP